MVFGGFCGYEKAPGPPGRKNLYFLIKILIKTVFKFERRILEKKMKKSWFFFKLIFFRESVEKLRKKYYFWL